MATTAGPHDDPDRYELIQLKSSGGEGQVFQGSIDIDGARIAVAVKVVHASRTNDFDEWRTRWRRQAELLRSLDHPGLVKVREVFEGPFPHERGAADRTTNTLYLVMNWVEGPTLEEWVSRNPDRDLLDSARLIGKLASAIDYLHSGSVTGNPVLHRDIKPANVIVGSNGPVLVDFGFTRVLANQSMTMVGTPAYVPPEVVSAGEHSTASDRYSFGATAYFMVTGQLPTPTDRRAMAERIVHSAGAEGRADIADHVLSMMDPDPARRPASTVGWAQQLGAKAVSDVAPSTVFGAPGSPAPLGAPPVQVPLTLAPPSTASGGFAPPGVGTTVHHPPSPTTVISSPNALSSPPPPPTTSFPTVGSAPTPAPEGRKKLLVAVVALVALLAAGLAYVALGRGGDDPADASDGPVATEAAPSATTAEAAPATTAAATTTAAPTTTEAPTTTVGEVSVPRVEDVTLETAQERLTDAGLEFEVIEEEGPGPYAQVNAADPKPGEKVAPGTVVQLTVAVQPALMIDVTGQTATTAIKTLKDYGITATTTEVLGEEGATGDVIVDQSPKVGEPFQTSVAVVVQRQPTIVYLTNQDWVESSNITAFYDSAQVSGEVYSQSVMLSSCSRGGYVDYDLARGYRIFRGAVGLSDLARSTTVYLVEIFVDGAKRYEQQMGLGSIQPIEIDLTGALRLRLQVTEISDGCRGDDVAFTNVRLLGLPSEVPAQPTG